MQVGVGPLAVEDVEAGCDIPVDPGDAEDVLALSDLKDAVVVPEVLPPSPNSDSTTASTWERGMVLETSA